MTLRFPRTFLRPRSRIHKDIRRMLQDLRKDSALSLHLGCGPRILENTLNCDLHNPEADRKLDSTDLSELEDGTVDLIEHHHMLEHLSFEQAQQGLSEWARVVKPGGYLVVTCPDLPAVLRRWLRAGHTERWQEIIQMIYGSQEHPGMFHRSGYDLRRLTELLDEHGFRVVYSFAPYPARATPSMLVIARRR